MRILVAEDERDLNQIIKKSLIAVDTQWIVRLTAKKRWIL